MTLRVYNTLTQKVEPFEPADPSHARVYVCGPTVYDYAHMGHARCYVVYDLLVRHLRASGMKVTFVRNVTDVDDKILKRAGELGEKPLDLSERFRKAYVEDMHRLGNLDPDIEPKVSDHLDDIVTLIGKLIDRGAAYQVDGDVYFRVSAFPGYGKLSHRKLEDLLAGASGRTDEARQERKEHPADFALWKKSEAGTLSWPSPWGEGRPGWHIECSAMSARYLGETFDLHGGGLDLVFPHHENEIAQSEAASGKPFVTHWMHNGFVETNKEKMSKSLGNFFTIRDMFERVDAEAIRYFMLTVSYRGPLAFDWDLDAEGHVTRFPQLADAEERLEYLYTTLDRFAAIPTARVSDASRPPAAAIAEFEARIAKALDDDLNFPVALAHVAELLSPINELADRLKKGKETIAGTEKSAVDAALGALRARLGLGAQDVRQVLLGIRERRARSRGIEGERVDSLIRERAEARTAKDFQRADALRKELQELGVELLDTPEGTSWRVPA